MKTIKEQQREAVAKMEPVWGPEEYFKAHEIGLDAIERISKANIKTVAGLGALLSVVMHATYAMAPDEELAEKLIGYSKHMAEEKWAEEKEIS